MGKVGEAVRREHGTECVLSEWEQLQTHARALPPASWPVPLPALEGSPEGADHRLHRSPAMFLNFV